MNTGLVRQQVPVELLARPTAHVHDRLQEVMRRLSIATQGERAAYISDHGHEVVDMVVTRMLHQGHASAFTLYTDAAECTLTMRTHQQAMGLHRGHSSHVQHC